MKKSTTKFRANLLFIIRGILLTFEYVKDTTKNLLMKLIPMAKASLVAIFALYTVYFIADPSKSGTEQVGFVVGIVLFVLLFSFGAKILSGAVLFVVGILDYISLKHAILFLYNREIGLKANYYEENKISPSQDECLVATRFELFFGRIRSFFVEYSAIVQVLIYIISIVCSAILSYTTLFGNDPSSALGDPALIWTNTIGIVVGACFGAWFAYNLITSVQEAALELDIEATYDSLFEED